MIGTSPLEMAVHLDKESLFRLVQYLIGAGVPHKMALGESMLFCEVLVCRPLPECSLCSIWICLKTGHP